MKKNIYNDKESWQKFLKIFFMTLGIGFTVSGIIFFFAYNWSNLPKFAKIGLTEALMIITTVFTLLPKINITTRNIIITGTAVLTGVLFAVFGQIYQTGANAYNLFLAWTVFITLWVIFFNFAPLWLIYIILINTTLVLYSQQVAKDWSDTDIMTLLLGLNTLILTGFIFMGNATKMTVNIPNWFTNILSLAVVSIATLGVIDEVFRDYHLSFLILNLLTLLLYSFGIWYGFKTKNGFYLAIISCSIVMMISALLIQINIHTEITYLLICMFILGSVTLIIKKLMDLQKKWKHER